MKRSALLIATIAALIVIAGLVWFRPAAMLSPGPMMAGHAAIAGDCRSCHSPLRGSTPERCLACHALADIGLHNSAGVPIAHDRPRVAFHQQLANADCRSCHSEHRGALTPESMPRFAHAQLLPAVQAQCDSCHLKPDGGLHRSISGNCQQCHTSSAWKPADFEHDKLFLLSPPHDASCTTCHVDGEFRRFTCYGCHEHKPAEIAARHRREGIADVTNCVRCHRSAEDEGHGEGGQGDD